MNLSLRARSCRCSRAWNRSTACAPHPARQSGHRHTPALKSRARTRLQSLSGPRAARRTQVSPAHRPSAHPPPHHGQSERNWRYRSRRTRPDPFKDEFVEISSMHSPLGERTNLQSLRILIFFRAHCMTLTGGSPSHPPLCRPVVSVVAGLYMVCRGSRHTWAVV